LETLRETVTGEGKVSDTLPSGRGFSEKQIGEMHSKVKLKKKL